MRSYNSAVVRAFCVLAFTVCAATAAAQTPQPFPRPNPTTPQKPPQPPPAPVSAPEAAKASPVPTPAAKDGVPTEAMLGAPIYPSAVYLTSYDAGRGQRFYIFGVTVPYVDMVNFYRTMLKTKGDELFEAPPTHQFETVRFRDESMAFPPSVTIKDFTYGGSAGYPNPKRGATPERFPTIIQIAAPPR